jgi:hypothetical protein
MSTSSFFGTKTFREYELTSGIGNRAKVKLPVRKN